MPQDHNAPPLNPLPPVVWLLALPIIDEENILRGIVTVDDAIDIILPLTWKKRLPKIFG